MKKLLICMIALTLITVGLSSCIFNSSSSPLSVQKVEGKKSANIDSSNTEKILALFEGGEWVEATPNCGYDFVFNYNGDMYRYHSECGTFYSLTDKQSLELGETSQAEVNDILESLFN